MRHPLHTKSLQILLPALLLAFSVQSEARSQQDQGPDPTEVQSRASDDPIRRLQLSPEQRQQIRAITEENREERQRINRQLREAQLALERTLDAVSPGEHLIEQRIREVADAHAAQIRMRVAQELRIRSVLTPDQVTIWRDLRARNRNIRRRLNDARESRRDMPVNGLAPSSPRERRRTRP